MFSRLSGHILAGSLGLLSALSSASALTLSLSSSPPTPGPLDVYNFTGAAHDGNNVSDGKAYPDGDGNDGFTYVAVDRPVQGQTFTTGAYPRGYRLQSIWVRHVGYTGNTTPTYWKMNANVNLTLRVTDPARVGSSGFVQLAETYQTTGSEGWAKGKNSRDGEGEWLKFTFNTPLTLLPKKTYGFDLSCSSSEAFFEWLGTSTNAFPGGGAYQGKAAGGGDTALTPLVGDRVFLVELAAADSANTSTRSTPPTPPAPTPVASPSVPVVEENSDKTVLLGADQGVIKGKSPKLSRHSSPAVIETWSGPADSVRWNAKVLTPGVFDVLLEYSVVGSGPGSRVEVAVGNQGAQGELEPTPDWEIYCTQFLGQVKIDQAGIVPVNVSALEKRGQWVMNLRSVRLRRSEDTDLQDPPTAAVHPALP